MDFYTSIMSAEIEDMLKKIYEEERRCIYGFGNGTNEVKCIYKRPIWLWRMLNRIGLPKRRCGTWIVVSTQPYEMTGVLGQMEHKDV